MGTRTVQKWIPTDAFIHFSHDFSLDLEDSDETDLYEEARSLNADQEPSDNQKKRLEERLREIVLERANDYLDGVSIDEMDSWTVKIQWLHKRMEVCEWCGSPNCDGDPDECESTPEYCNGCDEYTGHECSCRYCEECDETYLEGVSCDHQEDDEAEIEQIVGLLQSVGFERIQIADESGREEETVL